MVEINTCPICQSAEWQSLSKIKDHSISQELFGIKECKNCTFKITSPRPSDEDLGQYYESEHYISHSGQPRGLINILYLIARNYSLKWKLGLVNELQPVKTALDIGCGTGDFLNALKQDGWKVSGVEPNTTARRKAQQKTDASIPESLESVHGSFQLITLWHVLEHLPDLDYALKKICGALERDGTLLIAVPNHNSWDAKKYKEDWAGLDVPRHLWHFNKKSMVLLLQKYGFNLTRTIPMKLDAFYVSMLSEKYKGKSTGLISSFNGFWSGIKSNWNAKRTGEYSSLIYVASK